MSDSTEHEKTETIDEKKILIVEGKDEENFLKALFKILKLENIQIKSTRGKDQINRKIKGLVLTEGWDDVESIGLIRDADKSANRAFASLTGVLKRSRLPIPNSPGTFSRQMPKKGKPRTGIFIIPDGKNQGALESLCLSTVKEDNPKIVECIDSFMKCNKDLKSRYKKPRNEDKARCKAFLSLMEEDTSSLGVAAQKNYWDWKSNGLKPLIEFLKEL